MLLAIGSGTLALEHNCLWLDSGDARHLVIWPPSSRLVARAGHLTVVDASGAEVARVGDKVKLGGGELAATGGPVNINVWVESVIGEPVPPACRLGSYWDSAGRPA